MQSTYNASCGSTICRDDSKFNFYEIGNDFFQDITPIFYYYLNLTDDKNAFSLVCKKWCSVSDNNTIRITLFQAVYTDESLIAISQRFKFVENIEISNIWENLDPQVKLTPRELRVKYYEENVKRWMDSPPYNKCLEPITDEGVKSFKCLSELNLLKTPKVTYECIRTFTNLKNLHLGGMASKITNEELKHLTNLTVLDLTDNTLITDNGIENLINLTTLNLEDNMLITDTAYLRVFW